METNTDTPIQRYSEGVVVHHACHHRRVNRLPHRSDLRAQLLRARFQAMYQHQVAP